MSFMSLPSIGNKVISDYRYEAGNTPKMQMCFQEFRIKGLALHQSFL
jgi:hypothetical protein